MKAAGPGSLDFAPMIFRVGGWYSMQAFPTPSGPLRSIPKAARIPTRSTRQRLGPTDFS